MHAHRPLAALAAAATFVAVVLAGTAFSEDDAPAVPAGRYKQVAAGRPAAPAAVRARQEAHTAAAAARLAAQRAALEAAVAAKIAAREAAAATQRAAAGRLVSVRSLAARRPVAAGAAAWMAALARYPWDVQVAARILWCESRGDPSARNGRHVGLFQIANGPPDPIENIALAYRMYASRGWRPWHASRSCWA